MSTSLRNLLFFLVSTVFASDRRTPPLGQNLYRFPNAQVLASQREVANYGIPLRVLVTGGAKLAIKHVFLDSQVMRAGDAIGSGHVLVDLPQLPPGDWDEAHIYLDGRTGMPSIHNTTRTRPTRVSRFADSWHPRRIDYLEFSTVETLQQDRMRVVSHPDFDTPVMIKFASFPWELSSLDQEAAIYRVLHGSGATPEFLGHVTEGGKTVGFITEYIKETPPIRARNIGNCLTALRTLHERGIAHGDAHDGNCLIRRDGSAVLIDFELSMKARSPEEFERDLDIMDRCIRVILASP